MNNSEINIRDPYVYVENGKYYMYGTDGIDGRKFDVYISDNINEWKEKKEIFSPVGKFKEAKEFWAPELHKYKDKYYLFASFKHKGRNRGTQILVSDRPDGRFVPITDYPVTPEEWACLDGTLYVSDEGIPYIIFCHEWTQAEDGKMCILQLSDDLTSVVGTPKILFSASQCKYSQGKGENLTGYITDGPFIYKYNGKLFMFWSSVGEKYIQVVAVSDNGRVDGTWSEIDNLIYSEDGGHGMIFEDTEGKLKFVLHTPNTSGEEHPKFFDVTTDINNMFKLCDIEE